MGDNGVGKSTLIKIIAGSFSPTSGTISLDGKTVIFGRPREARDAGIEVVQKGENCTSPSIQTPAIKSAPN
jgi:simple sugar transport system ATP-binding protein